MENGQSATYFGFTNTENIVVNTRKRLPKLLELDFCTCELPTKFSSAKLEYHFGSKKDSKDQESIQSSNTPVHG